MSMAFYSWVSVGIFSNWCCFWCRLSNLQTYCLITWMETALIIFVPITVIFSKYLGYYLQRFSFWNTSFIKGKFNSGDVREKEYWGWQRSGRYVVSKCHHIFYWVIMQQLYWKVWPWECNTFSLFFPWISHICLLFKYHTLKSHSVFNMMLFINYLNIKVLLYFFWQFIS